MIPRSGFKSNVFAGLVAPVFGGVRPYNVRPIAGEKRGRLHVVSALRPIVVQRGLVIGHPMIRRSFGIFRRSCRCSLVCRVAHLYQSGGTLDRSSELSTLAVKISCFVRHVSISRSDRLARLATRRLRS